MRSAASGGSQARRKPKFTPGSRAIIAKRLVIPLILIIAAGLLGAGLPQASVSAQGDPPPSARLTFDGLLDMPRLPSAGAAAAPDAIPTSVLAPEYAAWSRLAFQSARNEHDWEIYSARGDGGEQWNVSNHPNMDIHPRLNRGATRIVFASNRDGNYEIYVMNADGSGQTRLTFDGANDVYPAWSPDGAQIVFQSYRDGNQAEIYAMNADGSRLRRLTYHGDYDGEPAWSPDGSQIAFTRRSSDQYRIWVMNADGGAPRQLSNQAHSENPAWSPDGGWIAYDADGNGDGWQELWLMDASGGNQRQLYDPPEPNTDALARSWAPGGKYIAFTRISFTQYQGKWYWTTAYLNACDVSAPWNIMGLNSSGADWHPDWQKTDIWPPTSRVLPLPAQSPAPFVLEWTFEETQSLIADLVIQMRDGPTGEWVNLKTNAWWGEPWDYFVGLGGHTYYFRSQATDNAGNVEPWPADYDAVTTIEALPPQTSVEALPAYSRNGVLVRWGGHDLGGSEMRSYDVQVRQGTDAWTDWRTEVAETAADFWGTPGVQYGFRVRGRDAAQNLEAWPPKADATTTLYTWAISGKATDNRGAPVADLTTATSPAAFLSPPSDITGAYVAYGSDPAPNYSVTWNKAAYGALPATAFPSDVDAELDIVLPPVDNVVQNWGFENGSAAWQFGGSLNATVTSTAQHTGSSAAFLGSEASPLQSIITLAGPLRDFRPPAESTMDSAGVIHNVWLESDGRIMYNNKPPSGSWTTPTPLPGPPAHYGGSVRLVADNANTIHVIWVAADTLYYSQNQAEAGWSTPVSIPGTVSTWEDPSLTVSASGVVKVVYVGPGLSSAGYGDVYFTERRRDGTWTPPQNISNTYFPDTNFKVLTDPSGLAHVLWQAADDPATATQQAFYSAQTAGGSWAPAINLSQYPGHIGDADMVIDSQSTVHVVWSADAIYYRTCPAGGRWSSTELIASTTGGVSLFADEQDRIHLAWGDSVSSRVRYAGRWLAPVDVFQNDHDTWRPKLLVDSSGTPHAVWTAHVNGSYSALYAGPAPVQTAGEATLSQIVQVPVAALAPTLSFMHRFAADFPSDSRLEVVIDDGISPTVVFSTTTGTGAWQHVWADLTPWAGRSVTLRFRVIEVAGGSHAWAYIDEVTVGSAHPDTWVGLAGRTAASPGAQFDHVLFFGNRGAAASNGHVTLQLPPELTFISADPPPAATTPELRWDVGDLAGSAAPAAIQVTLQVAASAVCGTTLTATAAIASDTPELEQANNTAQAVIFVGHKVYLPVVRR